MVRMIYVYTCPANLFSMVWPPTLMGRVMNEAEPEDLIKAFRGLCRDLHVGQLVGDLDAVCIRFEKLMRDVLRVTVRPAAVLLQQAAEPVEQVAQDIVKGIALGKPVIYTPGIWKILMQVIIHLPLFIFDRMKI